MRGGLRIYKKKPVWGGIPEGGGIAFRMGLGTLLRGSHTQQQPRKTFDPGTRDTPYDPVSSRPNGSPR
mgnify:CR=1 FL=1